MSSFDDVDTDAGWRSDQGTQLQAVVSVGGRITARPLPSTGELTIGRASTCDLVIAHASISRRHATITLSPLAIVDLGSRNGTRVHGKPVVAGAPTPLASGDAIQIGEATILIESVSLAATGHASHALHAALDRPFEDERMPMHAIDAECARSARSGSPFVIVNVLSPTPRAAEVLRACVRTSDVVTIAGEGELVAILVDTREDQVGPALERLRARLRDAGVTFTLGIARYPLDGVVTEQLLAHAHDQLKRGSAARPTAMDNVRSFARQVASGDLSVLITGETGVGKELCAEMIHRMSPRGAKPFVKLNCSALVESLIESELFGHERGAFTGAVTAHAGLLETGNTGTVFLDEIGELPLGVQAKLLRVLEERIVRRVGATTPRKVDVRFVCATNRDLAAEVAAGRFRADLYYRINGVTLEIPPLRERRSEIVGLAKAFASRARPGVPIVFGNEVIAALESHSWRGNIRELRNTIERALLLSSGGTIRPLHLVLETQARDSQPTLVMERISSEAIVHEPPVRPSQPLANEVAELERKRIIETLEEYGGNQTQAARALGVSRGTLIARMEEYAMRRPRKRG